MWETLDELAALQALLDLSFARASVHLLSIMTPERRLRSDRLAAAIPTPAVLNIASVTATGEPRVSAVDGHFLHGQWHFTTAADSPKARQLGARPAISASYTPRDGWGVFCHGRAQLLDGAGKQLLREHFTATYGEDPEVWGSIAYVRIDAAWMVAFAMSDEEMARIDAEKSARNKPPTT
ncbi:MAG: pyridoxamine 5'-phosphate oxidase family protein [Jatrophihabitantaceae bacterium]